MHCTVKPGRYCISFFLSGRSALSLCGPARNPEFSADHQSWRALCRVVPVLSSRKTATYRGRVAEDKIANVATFLCSRPRKQPDEASPRSHYCSRGLGTLDVSDVEKRNRPRA